MYGYGYSFYYRGRHALTKPRCAECNGTGAQLSANGIVLSCSSCNGTGLHADPALRKIDLVIAGVTVAFYVGVMITVFLMGGFN